ncbi:MAG TPA: hypothetical protein VIC33_04915 [Vicinamibacterales bacterium]|jgi:hypothetical protein
MTSSRLVLVLGMHRSGTSVAAAALPCLGVSLGDCLIGAAPDNERGFWEDAHVLDLDAAVLNALGQQWDTSTAIDTAGFSAPSVTRFSRTGRRIVQDRLSRFPLFGLKEPRICRLLPFWRPILQESGCEVAAVHVVRHPMSVAGSLAARNGLDVSRGLELWRRYVLDEFVHADPDWPAVVVDHGALMHDPVGQLRRVGAAISLELNDPNAEEFSRSFVDRGLWHQRDAREAAHEEVGDVWRLCQEAAADRLGVTELAERLRAM